MSDYLFHYLQNAIDFAPHGVVLGILFILMQNGWVYDFIFFYAPLLAGLICGLAARHRGLPVIRYAARGIGYWYLFFLPSIYLTLRMLKVPIPQLVVKSVYILMCALFSTVIVFAYVGISIANLVVLIQILPDIESLITLAVVVLITSVLIWVCVFALFKWKTTLQETLRIRKNVSEAPSQDLIIDTRYMKLFKNAFVLSLISSVLYFAETFIMAVIKISV